MGKLKLNNKKKKTQNYAIRIVVPDGQGAADFVDFVMPMKRKWVKKPENIIIERLFDAYVKEREDAGIVDDFAKGFLNNLRTLRKGPFHRIASRMPHYPRQIVVELADGRFPYEVAKFACSLSHAQRQHPDLNSYKKEQIKLLKSKGYDF